MTGPLRGVVAGASRPPGRLASSSARASRRPPPPSRPPARPPPPAPAILRPYKPSSVRTGAAAPPPPPPRPPDTLLTLWRRSWIPLTGAALAAGFLGFYIVGTAVASSAADATDAAHPRRRDAPPTGRPPALTGDNAARFDRELDAPEWWMGIADLRRALARRARGHVLEVAVGTGRNLAHYNWRPLCAAAAAAAAASGDGCPSPLPPLAMASFTGLDISVDMLDVARRRLVEAVAPQAASALSLSSSSSSPPSPSSSSSSSSSSSGATPTTTATATTTTAMADPAGSPLSLLGNRLRLVHADAHDRPLPAPPAAARHYDTVVQTFGLCSVADPVAVLANLASVVTPGTGRIILLEHGRGWFGFVNGLLDRFAGRHCAKYGCWWNRDIDALVHQAAAETPGLEVVKLERPKMWQFGTLVWVELRVTDNKKA